MTKQCLKLQNLKNQSQSRLAKKQPQKEEAQIAAGKDTSQLLEKNHTRKVVVCVQNNQSTLAIYILQRHSGQVLLFFFHVKIQCR